MEQNEILRQLVQCHHQPQHFEGGEQQQRPLAGATYQEFLSTQPPLFTRVEDPLDVVVWLRVVESKFQLLIVVCPDEAKTRFAAQQLRGSARTWSDYSLAMQPTNHIVTWDELKRQLLGDTTSQQASWTTNSMSYWPLRKETTLYSSMRKPSMTCASMWVIMQILMKRIGTCSEEASTPSSVSVSTLSRPTTTMSQSTWPSLKRTTSQLIGQKRKGR